MLQKKKAPGEGSLGRIEFFHSREYKGPVKTITWSIVAISAAAITAAVVFYAFFLAPADQRQKLDQEFKFSQIVWIFAGAFVTIASAWGLIEILSSGTGYGDGDIF